MQNIVIINPDQMRWDYMTPSGHPFIETKNLSRLAGMGTQFTHAFTACPMCAPARTSFITGRYPCEHGVRNYPGSMHPQHPNALEVLKQAGYHRALFGKDHIIQENAIGVLYDEGEDICIGNMDEHPDYKRSWQSGILAPNCEWNLTERLTTGALDYLDRRNGNDQPFFLTINYQDPHPYFTCPEPWASLFSPEQFELPPTFRRETHDGEPDRLHQWRQHSQSLEASEEDFKKAMAMYCGQIRYVDDQVGRVLDKLESLQLLDDTIVVFWSDHGEFVGDYGVTHKLAAFYDVMTRVPMVVWDPSGTLPRGQQSDLVECMDIYATILDMLQLPQPTGSRAHSLVQPDYTPRADVFVEGGLYLQPFQQADARLNLRAPHSPTQFGPGAMLRTRDWKLCLHSFDRGELYDLRNDPHECANLYDDPQHAGQVAEMTLRLMRRQLCQGQAPEHLPAPQVVDIDADECPIWDGDYSRHIDSAGPLPS
jgi:arylsulfatase A-like enzyme